MNKFFHSQLAKKTTMYVILISTFFALFSSAFQVYSEYKKEVNVAYTQLEQIEKTYLPNISSQAWLLEIEGLKISVTGLLTLPNIEYVKIDAEQNMLIESGSQNSENTVTRSYPIIHTYNGKSNVLGTMEVTATLDNIYQNVIDRMLLIIAVNTVKTFIVSLLIMMLFYRLISRHLNDIVVYLQQLDLTRSNKPFVYDRKHSDAAYQDELDVLNNTVYHILNNLQQLTTRLSRKERELKDTINSIGDAIIVMGEDGTIRAFNPAAEKLFGYTYDEIIGESVELLMPENHANNHKYYIQNYLAGATPKIIGIGRELEGLHKNKTVFPIRLSIATLPNDETGNKRFVATVQDFTVIKKQEDKLRRAQKFDALGKLSSGIAHDNNNILGIILGYSDILKSALNEQPKLKKYAEQINHAAQRGAKLTNKLLNFTRKKSFEESNVNINELLKQQKDVLQKLITVKTKLELQLPDNIWPIMVDENDLEDAIINLSINAMHAMEDTGAALLKLETCNLIIDNSQASENNIEKAEYVKISVIDNGCGMSDEVKDKIFDPFYSTKGELGTGLGLSQVFAFIQRSSGGISVKSAPDEGTCFELYIPRHSEKIEFMPEHSDDQLTFEGNQTILIVDDEELIRNLCYEILSQHGYSAIIAENSRSALEILKHQKVDLLLTDIVMPEIDGYELAHQVQKLYPDTKIHFMSGFDGSKNKALTNEFNNNKLLTKPFTLKELCQCVYNLLN